jgi:hypothetical protein
MKRASILFIGFLSIPACGPRWMQSPRGLRARTDPPDIVVSASTAKECLEELYAEAKRRAVEVQMWSPFRPSSIPWYECWGDVIGPLGQTKK